MRPHPSELEALVARLADGDRAAFDPLYEALWPLVARLANRMLLGAPEAEDAAQEAMAKLFMQVSQFESGGSVTSWVLAITAYECKTLRQKERRRRVKDGAVAEPSDESVPSPETSAIARDLEAAALEVLGTLSPLDEETIRALMSGERPVIAQATYRQRLARALKRLRIAWSSRHDGD